MKLASLPTGQAVMPWYLDHVAAISAAKQRAIAKRREEVARLRRERGGIRYLLSLMELPETHMTADELERCDEYLQYKMKEIRQHWTPEEEAERSGVMMRKTDRWFVHDGRIFQQSGSIQVVGGDEWGDIGDESYDN